MAELKDTTIYGDLQVNGIVNVPVVEGSSTVVKPIGSNATCDRTVSTSDPSGGKDGDIWLKYD